VGELANAGEKGGSGTVMDIRGLDELASVQVRQLVVHSLVALAVRLWHGLRCLLMSCFSCRPVQRACSRAAHAPLP
jgi:hypothetical protein